MADARVAVIIAAYNASASVGAAIRSALAQPEAREVVVVDDASTDDTVAAARAADDGSARLRVLRASVNGGPGAARNIAIAASTAPLLAILDADDLMLPGRLGWLAAGFDGDAIADNIVFAGTDDAPLPPDCGGAPHAATVETLDLGSFALGNISRPARPRGELGFLKPLLRREWLERHDLRYQSELRLGEDYALYAAMLAGGARFLVTRRCGYVARERPDSLSAEHSADDLARLAAVDSALLANPSLTYAQRAALSRHRAHVQRKCRHRRVLDARRSQGLGPALQLAAAAPFSVGLAIARDKWPRRAAQAGDGTRLLLPQAGPSPPRDLQPAPDAEPLSVAVCLCCHDRTSVVMTLKSLALQRLPPRWRLRVLVADNGETPRHRDAITAQATGLGLDLTYLHAPANNVSIARNACLDAADATWLAFIDDDEVAPPDWLATLLKERAKADVVLGSVRAVFGQHDPGAWLAGAGLHDTGIGRTDRPDKGYTCNALVRRAAVARIGLRFDPDLGRTGGEDTDFFRRLHASGARFIYCPDAWLFEEVPAARQRIGWIVRRRFRLGQIHARLDRRRGAARLALAASAAAKALWCALAALLRAGQPQAAAAAAARGAFHAGVLATLAGMAPIVGYGATSPKKRSSS